MIQAHTSASGIEIEEVQLVDLEDTAHLKPGKVLRGAQLGNWMWRSPEAHAMGPMEKPSDMFAFGIVVGPALLPPLLNLYLHRLTLFRSASTP
jgi:hypothetical protein